MNRRLSILPLALVAAIVVGCAARKEPPPAPMPPTADQVASLKAAILEISPQAKVGIVTAVNTDSPMVMISDLDVADVRAGDVFSIVDGTSTVVANAVVVQTVDGKLAANFTPVSREPVLGDLAVKF
jgi:hypothetical protein